MERLSRSCPYWVENVPDAMDPAKMSNAKENKAGLCTVDAGKPRKRSMGETSKLEVSSLGVPLAPMVPDIRSSELIVSAFADPHT